MRVVKTPSPVAVIAPENNHFRTDFPANPAVAFFPGAIFQCFADHPVMAGPSAFDESVIGHDCFKHIFQFSLIPVIGPQKFQTFFFQCLDFFQ